MVLVLIFSSLAFYSRSNYLIFYFIILIDFFNFKKIFNNRNFILLILSLVLIAPSLFFLIKWNGIVPPSPGSQVRIETINLNNIPLIFNIILIYLLPFAIFLFKFEWINFNKKKYIILVVLIILFFFLFYHFEANYYAGGAINKLLYFLLPQEFIKYFTIFISFLSFLLLINIFNKNWKILLYIFLHLILFLKLNFIFQEYFDPIFLILALMFSEKNFLKLDHISQLIYFFLIYFSSFLISSIIYQYVIV